ncbi:hypothetical protein M426DRAFT_322984 [Hypoxylon sp. CI-4A]|nr:hypothetical protein M426DRAFT_322984 [Hypoxylon sp. CI-4A]
MISNNPAVSDKASVRASLASYYVVKNEPHNARATLRSSVKTALKMLSDEVEENDGDAYWSLEGTLMHCGDDLNALTVKSIAWLIEFDTSIARGIDSGHINLLLNESSLTEVLSQAKSLLEQVQQRIDIGATAAEDERPEDLESYKELLVNLQPWTNAQPYSYYSSRSCDGKCGRTWDFENAMNTCKYCYI